MRYLYVLSADGPGPYARMTMLSALSVRAFDDGAHITLLTDTASEHLLSADTALRGAVDDVVVVVGPDADARVRSRVLKTAMRRHVTGDFLFLDSDTVVCGDLTDLTDKQADLSAVADQHRTEPVLPDVEAAVYDACGWHPPARINLNSGVLYWRDTPAAHTLGDLWGAKWRASHVATGRHNDQQALNSALQDCLAAGTVTFEELDAGYNAQVGLRPEAGFGARVWHIFSSDRGRVANMRTIFDRFWDGLAPLDPDALRPLLHAAHPFVCANPVDRAVVRLLSRRRTADNLPFNDWRRLWLAGQHKDAVKACLRAGKADVRRRIACRGRSLVLERTP